MRTYQIYPSLLNAWQGYVDSDADYERYWGGSETPPQTPEEYRAERRQALIDHINRRPFESEAADRGTALNFLTDRLTGHEAGSVIRDWTDEDGARLGWRVAYNGRDFMFPETLGRALAARFQGCMAQVFVDGEMELGGSRVRLYGYADYVGRLMAYDLKTTTRYERGKYASGWQHIVYPWCMHRMGCMLERFEYTVAVMGKSQWDIYTEEYLFRDGSEEEARLRETLRDFTGFLDANRQEITDTKIYGD